VPLIDPLWSVFMRVGLNHCWRLLKLILTGYLLHKLKISAQNYTTGVGKSMGYKGLTVYNNIRIVLYTASYQNSALIAGLLVSVANTAPPREQRSGKLKF